MNEHDKSIIEQTEVMFRRRYSKECRRVNRFMELLMAAQWVGGLAFALFYSPYTWIGQYYEVHVHVWAAVIVGGAISALAILSIRRYPDASSTRHIVAISQTLWSALLIHLSGGRIETHFHVFASLAILTLYRDWRILITATVVVAVDHLVRGIWYPLSVFGIVTESPFRWIEHALWVLFEVIFLIPGCRRLRNEIRELCLRQVEITEAKQTVDLQVEERTKELLAANACLAETTRKAEKLAIVARYTDNAVSITDANGNIEWINEGFSRISGFAMDEVVGKNRLDIQIGPNTSRQIIDQMIASVKAGQAFHGELLLLRKNGEECWMAVELKPFIGANGSVTQYISIESDISERKRAEQAKADLQKQLVDSSRELGMAEIATGVLHNVGNVLNSVVVSSNVVLERLNEKRETKLVEAANLVVQQGDRLGEYVTTDPRGKHFPAYLQTTATALQKKNEELSEEVRGMQKNIEHIKEIVAMQQNYAKKGDVTAPFSIHEAMEDALRIAEMSLSRHGINIYRDFCEDFEIAADKHKVIQILVNLISNAAQAVATPGSVEKSIRLSIVHDKELAFIVQDYGIGFSEETHSRLFQHGFTTKKSGHGFGLHSSANAAKELGGSLSAQSDGEGCGATFTLHLPLPSRSQTGSPEELAVAATE